MKSYLRFFAISLFFGLGCLVPAFAQIVSIQSRYVPVENIKEFVHRETNYWSEVARRGIIERRLARWELWQIATGMNIDEGANFFFIVEYRKPSDVDSNEEIWNFARVFSDMEASEIETRSLSTIVDQVYLYSQVHLIKSDPKVLRVNFARASDLGRYLELENTMWQEFVKERMDSNQTNVVSWDLMSVMSPGGVDRSYNALTIDGFEKLSDALQTSYGDNPNYPDLDQFREVHKKGVTRIYTLVKAVRGP